MKRFLTTPLFFFLLFPAIMLLFAFALPVYEEKFIHILLLFIAWHTAIVIHELGHLIFGSIHHLKFVEFTVGFITFTKNDGRIQLKVNKDWKKTGGIVLFLPSSIDKRQTLHHWKWFVFGGPFTGFVFGILSLIISWIYPSFFLNVLGYMSMAIAVLTALPLRLGKQKTDGSVYFLLKKQNIESDIYLCSLLLFQELLSDKSPSQWSQDLIASIEELLKSTKHHDDSSTLPFRHFLYYYYFDQGYSHKALEVLKPIIPLSNKVSRHQVQYFVLYSLYVTHQSLYGKDSLEPLQMHEKMSMLEPYSYYRTKAALLLKQDELDDAKEVLKKANKMYLKWIQPFGYSRVEHQFLKEMEKRMA